MSTIICPKCFTKNEIDDLAWGCANSDCSREGVPTSIKGRGTKTCESCDRAMGLRFCPVCGFQILVGEENIKNLPISIVGSESSGKSNYLSVLINETRHTMGRAYNCSLYPLGGDDTILQYENRYYKPLFEEGVCIDSTEQDSIRPLIYSLVFNDESVGEVCNLTFYDACGANFRNQRVMEDYNRSIYNSSGIIFLIDPTQIPGLRESFIQAGKPVLEDDFSALLSRTITLIRKGSGQSNLKKKITIPIAVCLSKLDLVREKLDTSSYLNYPSRHMLEPSYDITDHDCCNNELKAMIDTWAGSDLVNQVTSQFAHVGFFGFSALGSAPTEGNRIAHLAPFRVCDPFLWLLHKNNIIKAKRAVLL